MLKRQKNQQLFKLFNALRAQTHGHPDRVEVCGCVTVCVFKCVYVGCVVLYVLTAKAFINAKAFLNKFDAGTHAILNMCFSSHYVMCSGASFSKISVK